MKKRTLPLSLLIGAALAIPSLAMAAPANSAPVNVQTASADNTIETEAQNADGELSANQNNPFKISETQTISRASANKNASQQQMATELQAQPKAMLLEQQPKAMLLEQQPKAMLLEQQPKAMLLEQQPKAMLLEQQPKAMLLEQEALLDSEEDSSQVEDTAAL
ncbi:hypothetical protein [Psychrobacter sp. DAB_AL32B]|uniref:hypothetical protein n=1 Tax=Psychrobacter sp. DAB_AL32B TaxID=1028414 RepID=UPI000B7CA350|nr:hypothetical protein [Psychrobacter sp. DAB_AL32B]OXL17802.1 hypothetical protein CAN34_13390 [Psychrobacter sp. DAB_AL32B]